MIALKCRFKLLLFITLLLSADAMAQQLVNGRQVLDFNTDWQWYFAYNVTGAVVKQPVTLPHTWNAVETLSGKMNYTREAVMYQKSWTCPAVFKNKRLFLYFEGVNSVAQVFVNGQLAGEHTGGYTAFCLEITALLKAGEPNKIAVLASNAYRTDVLPLSGDFNVYGGIHRPVSLIVTGANCITPLDHASAGVFITQDKVTNSKADISVVTKVSAKAAAKLAVKTTVTDASGKQVFTGIQQVNNALSSARQKLSISQPHLWNSTADPYLYKVTVSLLQNGVEVDKIVQPLGLRYYTVDADKGFFLNGKYLDLRGLGIHEDVQGKGSAFGLQDYKKDIALVTEMGANALRLTHYPHGQPLYNLSDSTGIVLWSEIPLVGPGGYSGPGYIKSAALETHARQILTEMIRQNYNHPSVCFWGLFNELKLDYDDPAPFVATLNALVKQEDKIRPTTCASFLDNDHYNKVSDLIGWNKYYGWYGGSWDEMGKWADKAHAMFPQKPICVSEYGAGGSILHHSDSLVRPNASGRFHPEEWQTLYHENNWAALNKRPFIWGKYIWVLTDFGSSIRTEGDTAGINDKGLVTYDRSVKKDAYYFYKANWNPVPMIYIANRRNTHRQKALTDIKLFTNLNETELWVNGVSQGKKMKDALNRAVWTGIKLTKGNNTIEAKGRIDGQMVEDKVEWILNE